MECIYGGGAWTENGRMSDGSFQYHPQCAALRSEQLARNPYRCPRTDHYVPDPSQCLGPTEFPSGDQAPVERPDSPGEKESPQPPGIPESPVEAPSAVETSGPDDALPR